MAKKTGGRKRGSRNRGYYFRTGRGWYTSEGHRLLDEEGIHMQHSKTAHKVLNEAYTHTQLQPPQKKQTAKKKQNSVTMLEVCQAYLAHAKAMGAPKTHHDRADTLFDFCFGIPPEFRDKKEGSKPKRITAKRRQEMEEKRIHEGYGQKHVNDLIPLDIDQWLNAHENWNGGRLTRYNSD